jgi:hypothetical protein
VAIPEILPDSDQPAVPSPPAPRPLTRRDVVAAPDTDTTAFPDLALSELAALDEHITAAAWRRAHPADHVLRPEDEHEFTSGADLPLEGTWCLAAMRKQSARGGSVARIAFFYPPPVPPQPPSAALSDSGLGGARLGCILGLIEVERQVAGGPAGREALDSVRRRIGRWVGPGRAGETYGRWEAGSLQGRERWVSGGTTVLAGFDDLLDRVRVLAWQPASGIDLDSEAGTLSLDPATLPAAVIAAGGLDSAMAAPVVTLYDRARRSSSEEDRAGWSDSVMLAVLEHWVPAAQRLPARRRSAALLLADLLLDASRPVSAAWREEPTPVRARLRALGAGLDRWLITRDTSYTRSWLWDAFRADSAGPVGELAAMLLLAAGWDTSLNCGGGADLFPRVIERGEVLLSRLRTARRQALVRLYLARAYGDIVARAAGVGEDTAELPPAHYDSAAARARRDALRHYRAALGLLPGSAMRRQMEQEAWRLATGLAPLRTWFTCYYD